ncbi:J domain-containing protein, partial [uncultured Enorma sp.]|uniref:J domain-containing protein n=1 Tax=uncultured Enorma sp. TaxID=1714346 RepID=UPI002803E96A
MTRDEALSVLGLEPGASRAEILAAHRELAQMLHPDKFGENKRLRARAEQQMKRINEARDVLLKAAGASSRGGSASRR